MIDSFVLLTPILLLGVFSLLRFVGCLIKPDPPSASQPIVFQQKTNDMPSVSIDSNQVSTPAFLNSLKQGSLVVVWIWYRTTAQQVISVTDTANNAYQSAIPVLRGDANLAGHSQEIWYAKNVTGAPNVVVTATFSGTFAEEKVISANEYQGASQTDPLDVKAVGTGTADTASTDSPPTTEARLIFGGAVFSGFGAAAGNGFTQRYGLQGNVTEDMQVMPPGSFAATFVTNPPQPQGWIAQMVAFK
jgi:hypothetical protein